MFKKIMWKLFPPTAVNDDDVECARNAFDNARTLRFHPSVNNGVIGPFNNNMQTEMARENYMRVIRAKKKYEEYIKRI